MSPSKQPPAHKPPAPPPQDHDVDEAGDESFPASDPPTWTSSEAVPSTPKDKPGKHGKRGRQS